VREPALQAAMRPCLHALIVGGRNPPPQDVGARRICALSAWPAPGARDGGAGTDPPRSHATHARYSALGSRPSGRGGGVFPSRRGHTSRWIRDRLTRPPRSPHRSPRRHGFAAPRTTRPA
jgi:hypothetical protein